MTVTLEDLLPTLAKLCDARDQRRNLAELAEFTATSPSTFQRAFTRLVRESPKQYTKRLQLECAAILLMGSEASVLDVALATGFESHEGFTRAFSSHFQPPKVFRRRAREAGGLGQDSHLRFVEHVGPCLGLFRSSTRGPLSKRRDSMNYDITRRSIPEQTLLCKKARCTHADVADTLAQLLPAVFQHVMGNHIEMTGPPMTCYLEWGPGMTTLEAGLPVKAGAQGAGNIQVRVLPAGEAAITIHTGPYDGLSDAHAAVEQYLHANNLKRSGAIQEIYLTDPGEVPNPEEWKTQIVWPIGNS